MKLEASLKRISHHGNYISDSMKSLQGRFIDITPVLITTKPLSMFARARFGGIKCQL